MKILLAAPRPGIETYRLPNLALGYLASALRKRGHEVAYLDCSLEKTDDVRWRAFLGAGKYALVGLQAYTSNYRTAQKMLRAAGETVPRPVTVLGGPHVHVFPERVLLENPFIDYVFHGEAEQALPDLADCLDRNDFASIRIIPNLTRRDDSAVRKNPAALIKNLDDIGFPAWDLMDPRRYPRLPHGITARAYPIAPVMATRGCPYRCAFCAAPFLAGKKIRKRSPSRIVDEIQMLTETYGVREIHFEDDNFTFHKEFAAEVCQRIMERKLQISWACPNGVRIDSLDAELLKIMEASGCYALSLGIESASDRVLALMRKEISVAEIEEKISLLRRTTRIRLTGFFIFGFPGETAADLERTREWILRQPFDRISITPFVPYPGAPAYAELEGLEQIPAQTQGASHAVFGEDIFVSASADKRRLFKAIKETYLKFYLRAGILPGIIKEVKSPGQWLLMLRQFLFWSGFLKVPKSVPQDKNKKSSADPGPKSGRPPPAHPGNHNAGG